MKKILKKAKRNHLTEKERREKLSFEFKRKGVHALAALSIPIYYILFRLLGKQITLLGFLFILFLFIAIEFFRIVEKRVPEFHFLWRQKEENSLGGQVYFMIGIIIAFAVFDFEIAMAGILMTVFGDMAGALVGISFGKHPIYRKKSWEGSSAELVVDALIGFIVIGGWWIVLPMAIMATVVETIFPHVDDNLAIPVFAGFVGQSLKLLF